MQNNMQANRQIKSSRHVLHTVFTNSLFPSPSSVQVDHDNKAAGPVLNFLPSRSSKLKLTLLIDNTGACADSYQWRAQGQSAFNNIKQSLICGGYNARREQTAVVDALKRDQFAERVLTLLQHPYYTGKGEHAELLDSPGLRFVDEDTRKKRTHIVLVKVASGRTTWGDAIQRVLINAAASQASLDEGVTQG
ncbi:uncharacterized protein E0L32_010043 [Thyridium curvatum]|uniref:Uncharacterized protein n=1 Tax=Thyridium curvatum TaxID=1093900 RepID=A0A507APB9_9PEZI|nr:uncharacterized protein E0L32_010043 [Thyridium curvatum]TPX08556.1 hypothetical protein E0L32_010043 [Thyridium curvatum]